MGSVTAQPEPRFYKVSDIARIFDVTPQAVYKWINEGKVKAVEVGGRKRISALELDRLSREGTNESVAVKAAA